MLLHENLAAEFRRRVTAGEWRDGSAVPSEAALCAEFACSRGPVRQALAALRSDGMLAGGRGSPPIVRAAIASQPVETFVSFTEWAESIGRTPGQRTLEIARRPGSAEVTRELGVDEGSHIVSVHRLRLLDGVPAMVERAHFTLEVGALLLDAASFDPDSGSIYRHLRAHGVDLFRARHTIDAVAADVDDAALLGVEPGSALLRERRVTRSSHDTPLEYADDRYLPTQANFTIDNRLSARAPLTRVQPDPQEETRE